MRVDVDHDAVGAGRDGGAGERHDQVAAAGGVRRVDDHRQVATAVGPSATAERRACCGSPARTTRTPRSHSTMSRLPRWAMYSAAISHSSYVAVQAALEHDRLAGGPDRLQQRRSSACCGCRSAACRRTRRRRRRRATSSDLGDDRQLHLLADLGEDAQPGHAETLERIRRGARLVGAAAQQRRARRAWPSAPPRASAPASRPRRGRR